jgi:hypothetical protein
MRRSVLVRLASWQIALNDSIRYVSIGIILGERFQSEAITVRLGTFEITSTFGDYGQSGLNVAAAVLFRQIFGKGKPGDNVAGNHDQDVVSIRDRMVEWAKQATQISEGDYTHLFQKIEDQRHQRIAHYDGSMAFFQENGPGSISATRPGLQLTKDELILFVALMHAMSTFLTAEMNDAASRGVDETS